MCRCVKNILVRSIGSNKQELLHAKIYCVELFVLRKIKINNVYIRVLLKETIVSLLKWCGFHISLDEHEISIAFMDFKLLY